MLKIIVLCLFHFSFAVFAKNNTNSLFSISQYDKNHSQFESVRDEVLDYINNENTKIIYKIIFDKAGYYLWVLNNNDEKSISAYLLSSDHGGYLEKVKFLESGSLNRQYKLLIEHSGIKDLDQDGEPDFYLTYVSADKNEKKYIKFIVYKKIKNKFTLYKASAQLSKNRFENELSVDFNKDLQTLSPQFKKSVNDQLRKAQLSLYLLK